MAYLLVGHSSFYLRAGWIKKGVEYIEEYSDENAFSKSNIAAIDILGIGSVMVQSLRFWMGILDILKKEKKQYSLKRDIKLIIEKDPYFQNKNTLWLLHTYIMERDNNEEIPVLWDLFIKNKKINTFTEESAEYQLSLFFKENDTPLSTRSAKDSISVFIKNYYRELDLNSDPEDNLYSPFTRLEYLKKNSEGEFYFRSIEFSEITEYIALYLLMRKLKVSDRTEINLNEAYAHFNSIIKIRQHDYEKLLNKLENRGIISQDRAAGLQNIHIKNSIEETEIIERILESEY